MFDFLGDLPEVKEPPFRYHVYTVLACLALATILGLAIYGGLVLAGVVTP